MKRTVSEVIHFLSRHRHDYTVVIADDKLVVQVPSEATLGAYGEDVLGSATVTALQTAPNTENIPHMLRDMAHEFDEGKNDATIVLLFEINPDGRSCMREFGHVFSQHDNTKIGALYRGIRVLCKRASETDEDEED